VNIHTILEDAEPNDAARAAKVMASTIASDESLAERIQHKAKALLSKTHDELVADIEKARILKAALNQKSTPLKGAE
jgi:ribosome-binding protein aMBF1 (putative translation factor)